MSLFDDFPDGVCRRDVPLAPLTWFKLGGPADYLISPQSHDQLATVIRRCRDGDLPFRYLGLGANVLVPDEGVRGVVIRLDAEAFGRVEFGEAHAIAGAGADMTKLVRQSVRHGLAGIEVLAGIPGTVGGGVAMNCGGRFGEISTSVRSIRAMDAEGAIARWDREDLDFGYRHCGLGGACVLEAELTLEPTDPQALDLRFREIWMYKQNTQPPLGVQSVGCIFRNPDGRSAGQIIDRAGLKGLRIGSAAVSQRHGNFVVADPGGRAADVIAVIRLIQRRVMEHSGVHLEPEVKIWEQNADARGGGEPESAQLAISSGKED